MTVQCEPPALAEIAQNSGRIADALEGILLELQSPSDAMARFSAQWQQWEPSDAELGVEPIDYRP